MYSLVFLTLIGFAAAAPQTIMPYSYGIIPYTSHITPYMDTGIMPINTGITGYMPRMITTGMITPGIPIPTEITPEVKQSKAAFAIDYQKALIGSRQKRDIAAPIHTIPFASTINMMPYTPNIIRPIYGPSNIYSTPIISHY